MIPVVSVPGDNPDPTSRCTQLTHTPPASVRLDVDTEALEVVDVSVQYWFFGDVRSRSDDELSKRAPVTVARSEHAV
jgi:hypothetical protein